MEFGLSKYLILSYLIIKYLELTLSIGPSELKLICIMYILKTQVLRCRNNKINYIGPKKISLGSLTS